MPSSATVQLNGLPLDKALTKIVSERPLWQPTGDNPALAAARELEAAALAGDVTAHGKLYTSLGSNKAERDQRYAAWCKEHGAKAGKAAVDKAAAAADDDEKNNPWSAANWNVTEQGRIVRTLGIAVAQRLSASQGSSIGATKPAKVA